MTLTQNVLLIGGVKRGAVSGRLCRSACSGIFSRVQAQSCPQSDELDRRRDVRRYSTVLVSHDTGCGLGRDRGGDSVVAMNPVGPAPEGSRPLRFRADSCDRRSTVPSRFTRGRQRPLASQQ